MRKSKYWVKVHLVLVILIVVIVSMTNYLVDPYSLYGTDLFKNKPKEFQQMRLLKVISLENIQPKSIVLGTSRAELAINPEHEYFIKPSYNLANSGASMYETKLYTEKAINEGVEQILFIVDWRMFNEAHMRQVPDFDSFFLKKNIYKYLLNYDVFKDSIYTLRNQDKPTLHKRNGQMTDLYLNEAIEKDGGHLKMMIKEEKHYYKNFSNNNTYKDTKKSAFKDFEHILELCYDNNIKLDLVFGPSHITQWEAFDYYLGYDTFLKWKKDIVLLVESLAKYKNKYSFRITDFSVYHELTSEEIPINPNQRMKFHVEGSHYTSTLGTIVLDRLIDKSSYNDFGIVINSSNIEEHIKNLKKDRKEFIDIKSYRKLFFDK